MNPYYIILGTVCRLKVCQNITQGNALGILEHDQAGCKSAINNPPLSPSLTAMPPPPHTINKTQNR